MVYDPVDWMAKELKRAGITMVRYACDPLESGVWRVAYGIIAEIRWFVYAKEGVLGANGVASGQMRENGWLKHGVRRR